MTAGFHYTLRRWKNIKFFSNITSIQLIKVGGGGGGGEGGNWLSTRCYVPLWEVVVPIGC